MQRSFGLVTPPLITKFSMKKQYNNRDQTEKSALPRIAGDLKLTRIAGVIPFACWFIVINEFCERLAYYGGSAPFQNYVQFDSSAHILDPENPNGALNLGSSMATLFNNYFTFIAYSSPLLGAYIADQYFGKFKTILSFGVLYMIGFFFLTFTSIPQSYLGDGTPIFSSFAYPGFVISITIIGLGTGGIKALVSPMCADQVPDSDYTVTKNGQEYIVDPDLTIQSVYNWFYCKII
jgi:proton-dependent oligopeptide transporter, POT family